MYGRAGYENDPRGQMVQLKDGYFVRPADVVAMKPIGEDTQLLLRAGAVAAPVPWVVPGMSPARVHEVITEVLREKYGALLKGVEARRPTVGEVIGVDELGPPTF